MTFTELQPAAYIPNPDTGAGTDGLHVDLYTLTFPAQWREPVLNLYRSTRQASTRDRVREVPIQSLNRLIRTVAPDLVTVDANASFDAARPWLYSRSDYPTRPLTRLVHTWLRSLAPSAESWQDFRDTARTIDPDTLLQWKPETVDLLEHGLSPAGTCEPAERLYRVLPEVLADRIAAQPPYEFCGHTVRFHRVAVDARANGAELMSWPPLKHRTRVTDSDTRQRLGSHRDWRYSVFIRVSLRTVPFSPTPQIYISTRIRRWVAGEVFLRGTRAVSAYLLTHQPFLEDGGRPGRFAVASFAWNHGKRRAEWTQSGPEGMLTRIGALDNLPSAEMFAKEPDSWIDGRDGVEGGACYHTMMGWHGIGAGLMPSERRRLTEWAGAALAPEFTPAPPLERSNINQNPARTLKPTVPVPAKNASEQAIADAVATNERISQDNATTLRELAALALDRTDLTAVLLYQTESMCDRLIDAAEHSLGLADYRDATGPHLWSWNTPGLQVRIHTRKLGSLGEPLTSNDRPPKRGDEHIAAIGHRRAAVATHLRELTAELGETATVTFVELRGADTFRARTTDPKFAIRLGCADAGTVSQFFTPENRRPGNDQDDDASFRAAAAWADGLRQLGLRFVPSHTLGKAIIPDALNQVAFWLVKRQTTGPTDKAQYTPVAILIRPGQKAIVGRTPDTEWMPYPKLLIALTGQVRPADLSTKDQQTKNLCAFVKNTLYILRSTPTLALIHAQNTRSRWPWLTNSGLLPEHIQFGDSTGPIQRVSLYGDNLRFARIATNQRDETPQWWAPKPDDSGGISKGLWKISDRGGGNEGRVFYSTSGKPGTHNLSVDTTKLTPRITPTGKPDIQPAKNAWVPELLEITMLGFTDSQEAENWAMFIHQQRFTEDYRQALALPLIQHLAQLTSQYGLPHDDSSDHSDGDQPGQTPDDTVEPSPSDDHGPAETIAEADE